MSFRVACIFALLLTQTVLIAEVEGQIIRRLRERRAAASSPEAVPGDPALAPLPLPRLRGFLARRLQLQQDLVAQEDRQPTPATGDQQDSATARREVGLRERGEGLRQVTALRNPSGPMLSPAELSEMDMSGLRSVLANLEDVLQDDLNRFSSAESWQGFLNLPAEVFAKSSIDEEALEVSLDRFNRVAANPRFSQISSLSSFEQTRKVLAELANRTVGPQLPGRVEAATYSELADSQPAVISQEEKSAAEELPAPEEVPAPARINEGERSILIQSK